MSFKRDSTELAETYEQTSDFQYAHGLHLVRWLALQPGERVLDVGAGTGRLAEHIAGQVGPTGAVVAIDPLPERVALARQRAGDRFTVLLGQAEDLSGFADGAFDAVVLNSVFHWVADQPRALSEAWRVLKPGGQLVVNSADAERPHQLVALLRGVLDELGITDHSGLVPHHVVSERKLQSLLHSAGFNDLRLEPLTFQDSFRDGAHLLHWHRSSTFGNFLADPDQAERARRRLAEHLSEGDHNGPIQLNRHLVFARARKPLELLERPPYRQGQ